MKLLNQKKLGSWSIPGDFHFTINIFLSILSMLLWYLFVFLFSVFYPVIYIVFFLVTPYIAWLLRSFSRVFLVIIEEFFTCVSRHYWGVFHVCFTWLLRSFSVVFWFSRVACKYILYYFKFIHDVIKFIHDFISQSL